jgi:hypothetical protein
MVGTDFLKINFTDCIAVYQGAFEVYDFNQFFMLLPTALHVESFSYFLMLRVF